MLLFSMVCLIIVSLDLYSIREDTLFIDTVDTARPWGEVPDELRRR